MDHWISKLTIENFGPYQEAEFDFTAGLNLIRGPNLSGKTWLLRAMAAVLYNWGAFSEDDALDEVRYSSGGGKKAHYFRIKLSFADGSWVERYRDKSTNMYTICKAGDTPQEHMAIGRGFYPPVGEVTGIFPIKLDGKTETIPNVRLLEDPHFFLIGESPQKQDAILTQLVGIDVIERAADEAVADRRQLVQKIKQLDDTVSELSEEQKKYSTLPLMVKQLSAAADGLTAWSQLTEDIREGAALLRTRSDVCHAQKIIDQKLEALGEPLVSLRESVTKAELLVTRTRAALGILNTKRELMKQMAAVKSKLKCYKHLLDLSDAFTAATDIVTMVESALSTWKEQQRIQTLLSGLKKQITGYNDDVSDARKRRRAMLEEFGVCPLCGQEIKEAG